VDEEVALQALAEREERAPAVGRRARAEDFGGEDGAAQARRAGAVSSFEANRRGGELQEANDRLHASLAEKGEVLTGPLCVSPEAEDLHAHLNTYDAKPFNPLGEADLCPGSATLDKINAALR
jgi:hypothetical protein